MKTIIKPEMSLMVQKIRYFVTTNAVSLFRYLDIYEKYSSLLDQTAMEEVIGFLGEEHSLEVFAEVTGVPSLSYLLLPSWPHSPHWRFTPAENRGHQQPVEGDRLHPRHRAPLHVLPVRRQAERGPVRPGREAEEQDHRL